MKRISYGICPNTNDVVGVIESHIIKFLATVFNKIWLGLHSYIVLKLFGIVILPASSASFDLRYIKEIANKADGAVTCKLTYGPYFMLEHLD